MNSIFQVLTIVAAILVLSSGTQVKQCDDGDDAVPLDVQIGDCNEGRCVLERGETYNFMVKFKAPQDDDNVQTTAIGSAHGFEITLQSGVDAEACQSIQEGDGEKGTACPLKKDTEYVYEKPVTVSKTEFRAKGDVEWYLYSGEDVLYCFKIPVEVKDKPKEE